MIKDGGLNFDTQSKIEFLPPNNGSKKCLEKSPQSQQSAICVGNQFYPVFS